MSRDIEVTDDENGARLDRWLLKQRPDLNYILVQKLLRKGQIRVDGKRAKPDLRLMAGQSVRMPLGGQVDVSDNKRPAPPHVGDHLRPEVIYEDDDVLVFDKPSGLAVQGGSGLKIHLEMMMDEYALNDVPPRLVHRLDRETSGVLLMARSTKVARILGDMFSGREMHKTYLALVSPAPTKTSGLIDLPLDKMNEGSDIEKMHVIDGGRPAQTKYRVVEKNKDSDVALVEFYPLTGRTHQIRVHAAACGFPLLGDDKYGGDLVRLKQAKIRGRVMLHASTLEFSHPITDNKLRLSAPMPEDMRQAAVALGIQVADD